MSLHRHRFVDTPAEDIRPSAVVHIGHDDFFVVDVHRVQDVEVVLVLDSPDGWSAHRCPPGTPVPTCPAR